MLQKLSHAVFTAILLAAIVSEAKADTIELRADDWCPYTCASSEHQGLLVEIATHIFTAAGHRVNFRTVPWTRAVLEVQHHQANGLIGVTPAEAPSLLYSAEPLMYAEDHWFVRTDNPWRFDDLTSLAGIKLGATEGYSYGQDIDAYIAQHKSDAEKVQLYISDVSLQRNLRKLQRGNIDVLLEDCRVVTRAVQRHKKKVALVSAGLASQIGLYIGFAADHPKSKHYIELLNKGSRALVESGELAQMLARYPATLCQANR